MISFYESRPNDVSVPFDIGLAISFPLLILSAWPLMIPTSIFLFLTGTHVIIAIYRYGYKNEIRWPVWADIFAIVCGVLLSLVWVFEILVVWKATLFICVGLILIYGHGRKLWSPELPYYYGIISTGEKDENSLHETTLNF